VQGDVVVEAEDAYEECGEIDNETIYKKIYG